VAHNDVLCGIEHEAVARLLAAGDEPVEVLLNVKVGTADPAS
jgi:hypothetical protein